MLRILGEHPFATGAGGRLRSHIGTIFPDGNTIVYRSRTNGNSNAEVKWVVQLNPHNRPVRNRGTLCA